MQKTSLLIRDATINTELSPCERFGCVSIMIGLNDLSLHMDSAEVAQKLADKFADLAEMLKKV